MVFLKPFFHVGIENGGIDSRNTFCHKQCKILEHTMSFFGVVGILAFGGFIQLHYEAVLLK